MLPDFPKAKASASAFILKAIQARIAESPILSGIRHTMQHEGKSSSLQREDLSTSRTDFRHSSQTLEYTREEMRTWHPAHVARKVSELAAFFESEQTRALFDVIEQATEESGNTVAAGPDGFTKEAFLEMQRKLLYSFDATTGEPTGGKVILHPDSAPAFEKALAEWESDEQFMKALTAIQDEKREEWRAREASRKLAD
jgi:hypothetical protein